MSNAPEDLLPRLQAREPAAFDALVREFHGAVFRLCQRLLSNPDDAQEAAQDVFLAAYEGIAGFAGRSPLKTWLLAIAYRKAADRLRLRYAAPESLDGELEELDWNRTQGVQDFTDWAASPEDHYQRGEIRAAIAAALAQVPAASRAVFELRDLQGLSFEETAQVLGITAGAARVRLHRVRQVLMGALQQRFGMEGT